MPGLILENNCMHVVHQKKSTVMSTPNFTKLNAFGMFHPTKWHMVFRDLTGNKVSYFLKKDIPCKWLK